MEETLLFSVPSLSDYLYERTQQIRAKINGFSESDLLDSNIELQVSHLVTKSVLKIPVLDESNISFGDEEVERDVNDVFSGVLGRKIGKGKKYTFFIPFNGNSDLFTYRPGQFTMNPPVARIEGQEILLEFTVSMSEKLETVVNQRNEVIFNIKKYLGFIEAEVGGFNRSLAVLINGAVASRKEQIEKTKKEADDLGLKRRN